MAEATTTTLRDAIVRADQAAREIAKFKEAFKEPEEQTKAQQESLVAALGAALTQNKNRPLKTSEGVYIFLREVHGRLMATPDRVAEICERLTPERLMQVAEDLRAAEGHAPSLADTLLVSLQDEIQAVCCPVSQEVAVAKKRPADLGSVEAREASADVQRKVSEYQELQAKLAAISKRKREGVAAFREQEERTSLVLTASANKAAVFERGGTMPSKLLLVPAPATQKQIQVEAAVRKPEDPKLFADLPQVPEMLQPFVPKPAVVAAAASDTASILSVPGLPEGLQVSIKTKNTTAAATSDKPSAASPPPRAFMDYITKDVLAECAKPALAAAGDLKTKNVLDQTATKALVERVWTAEVRAAFAESLMALRERVTQAERERKAARAAEKGDGEGSSKSKRPRVVIKHTA